MCVDIKLLVEGTKYLRQLEMDVYLSLRALLRSCVCVAGVKKKLVMRTSERTRSFKTKTKL